MGGRPLLNAGWALACLLSGCFPQLDGTYEGIDSVGGGGSGGGTSSGTPCACPGGACEARCVAIPEGWDGPVALTDPDVACGGAFPTEVSPALRRATDPGGSCGCTCGKTGVASCPNPQITTYDGLGCAVELATELFVNANCKGNITGAINAESFLGSVGPPQGETCEGAISDSLVKASWLPGAVCAGGIIVGGCEDGAFCAPIPGPGFVPDLCITRLGNQTCPAGFTLTAVVFVDAEDQRACPAACSCTPTPGACSTTFGVYDGGSCMVAADASAPAGVCTDLTSPGFDVAMAALPAVVSPSGCTPDPVEPVGAVVETPRTVCCLGAAR